MDTGIIYEYQHKKFDLMRKRSREDKCISTTNSTSSITEFSIESILNHNPPKRRKVNQPLQLQLLPTPVFVPGSKSVFSSIPFYSTKMLLPLNGIIFTAGNRITIKSEPLDYSVNTHQESSIKTEPQPTLSEIKNEQLSIEEELMELQQTLTIPSQTYETICKYRGNMARKFPNKQRSCKEQSRLEKNNYSVRKNRRIQKIQHVATEEEYKLYKKTSLQMEEYAIRAAAYFKELMKLTDKINSDVIVID
ncbi:uncharacterized protein LOC129915215 [Episyrphus balteatus]|uniref:uncharacterized protein LOC129915215 n=1 Tax=Episyrphus balteatus TaxID=286459 RepID=UPI002484FC15|nr:uncharacterized protein LOC129915215 [Episyrphus balteatus]